MDSPKLRPYQEEDVRFITQFKTAGVFNEQRTGKTPTSLMCIKQWGLQDQRVLIVATVSSMYTWQQEYEKWLQRPCQVVTGNSKVKKLQHIQTWQNGLVISLDTLKDTAVSSGYLDAVLKMKPSAIILDEAHHIKNTKSCAYNSIKKLKRIPYRLALTGTPAYGKANDIFAILNFLFPDEFSSKYRFNETYFEPEQICIGIIKGKLTFKTEYNNFKKGMDLALQEFLSKTCTQRKRKEVMQWLPAKDKQTILLPLTKEQEKYINELSDVFETEHVVTKGVLDRFIRFRQICNDPALLDLKGESPKTEYILNHILENPDTPLIIFSNFTSYLWRLHDLFHVKHIKHAMITGEVTPQIRSKFQQDFQSGKFNVFLINIQAGKEALTLDRAEEIIFADVYPPIGAIEQAEDRFIATSEDKANKPHTIYYLTMQNSYEEQLLQLLQQRKTETEILNDFKSQLIK